MDTLAGICVDKYDLLCEVDELGQKLGLWEYIDIYTDTPEDVDRFYVRTRNKGLVSSIIRFFSSKGYILEDVTLGIVHCIAFMSAEQQQALKAWIAFQEEQKNNKSEFWY